MATYERHFADLKNDLHTTIAQPDTEQSHVAGDTLGKECSNLIILLSELYNFQVISCVLVYDVIRGLLDGELTEFQVELLLKITRSTYRYRRGGQVADDRDRFWPTATTR